MSLLLWLWISVYDRGVGIRSISGKKKNGRGTKERRGEV